MEIAAYAAQLEREMGRMTYEETERAEQDRAVLYGKISDLEGDLQQAYAKISTLELALRVCLGYWLGDADPEEHQGSVERLKSLCAWPIR